MAPTHEPLTARTNDQSDLWKEIFGDQSDFPPDSALPQDTSLRCRPLPRFELCLALLVAASSRTRSCWRMVLGATPGCLIAPGWLSCLIFCLPFVFVALDCCRVVVCLCRSFGELFVAVRVTGAAPALHRVIEALVRVVVSRGWLSCLIFCLPFCSLPWNVAGLLFVCVVWCVVRGREERASLVLSRRCCVVFLLF